MLSQCYQIVNLMLRNCYRRYYYSSRKIFHFLINLGGILLLFTSTAKGITQHYRLILNEKPATSVSIGWELIGGCPDTQRVYYDTIDHGQDTSAYAFQSRLTASFFHQGMENYFCQIEHLQPDTRYYFVIAEDEGISPRMWFTTLSEEAHPWKAYWISPLVSQSIQKWSQFCQNIAQGSSDFVLVEGLSQLKTEEAWRHWLGSWQSSIAENGRIIPLIIGGEITRDIQYLFNLTPEPATIYSLTQKSMLVVARVQKMPKKRFWKRIAPDTFVVLHAPSPIKTIPDLVDLVLADLNANPAPNVFLLPADVSFVEMIWQENHLQILSPQRTKLLDVFASP